MKIISNKIDTDFFSSNFNFLFFFSILFFLLSNFNFQSLNPDLATARAVSRADTPGVTSKKCVIAKLNCFSELTLPYQIYEYPGCL